MLHVVIGCISTNEYKQLYQHGFSVCLFMYKISGKPDFIIYIYTSVQKLKTVWLFSSLWDACSIITDVDADNINCFISTQICAY